MQKAQVTTAVQLFQFWERLGCGRPHSVGHFFLHKAVRFALTGCKIVLYLRKQFCKA